MACVIVGAGIAGTTLALKLLANKRQFTLVNPSDYFHLNFCSVRAIAAPGWAEKSMIPLAPTFGDSFKQGRVVDIKPRDEDGDVILQSGEKLPYKYLALATGTTHMWPIKLVGMKGEEALSEYADVRDRVKEAKTIVVVGGGATGLEVVAELKHFHPDKEVVLIHATDQLLTNSLSDKSQKTLQDIMKKDLKTKLLLGERVTNLSELPVTGPGVVKTDKGTTIEADVLFKFIGLRINTEAYKNALGSAMTETGALKVDKCLRVEGYNNIFALGDCTNTPEAKYAVYAIKHGEHVADSIMNLDKGKPAVEYKPNALPILAGICLGPDTGFGRTKGDWPMPGFILKKVKSRYLFSDKWWKDMKQECP